jgi:drug/metabolite transporter (DMT)-like permease
MVHGAQPTGMKVFLAFAAVYIVWGSTYYGIREALTGFPPFLLGGFRFVTATAIMFAWCAAQGMSLSPGRDLKHTAISGILLLLGGNGTVVWVERTIPSSVVAIMIAVAPLSFVLLDKPMWRVNLRSWNTLLGVAAGFAGVYLLFSEKIAAQLSSSEVSPEIGALLLMLVAVTAWPAGSLYTKYNPATIPPAVHSGWQMLAGGLGFLVVSTWRDELSGFDWSAIPLRAWVAELYLVVFGSIIGFSAYVWLLRVRPATQVSTYAYVNPVVAVLIGVFIGDEHLGWREMAGLVVILGGVLLINLARYARR